MECVKGGRRHPRKDGLVYCVTCGTKLIDAEREAVFHRSPSRAYRRNNGAIGSRPGARGSMVQKAGKRGIPDGKAFGWRRARTTLTMGTITVLLPSGLFLFLLAYVDHLQKTRPASCISNDIGLTVGLLGIAALIALGFILGVVTLIVSMTVKRSEDRRIRRMVAVGRGLALTVVLPILALVFGAIVISAF